MKWLLILKRGLIVGVAFFGMGYTSAQNSIQTAIDAFAANPYFVNASISFMATDTETGTVLASKNSSLAFTKPI